MPLPPGQRGPAAAQTFAWAFRPVPFMERMRERHGDVFTVRLAQIGTFVFVSAPAELKRIFTAPVERLAAGDSNRRLEPILGPRSVLLLDGPEHLRQRRLLLPPFHGERMAGHRDLMVEIARDAAARWPRGESVALQPRFQDITLEIILTAVLGLGPGRTRTDLKAALAGLLGSIGGPVALMPWLRRDLGPGSPWRRFLAARGRADRLLHEEIARRRATADLDERTDVLSLLLAARDEEGRALSPGELRDEVTTLLVAGHETTATGLSWGMERLLRTPDAFERARTEARGQEDDGYLDAVVTEILRRRPPLPLVARTVKNEPWEIGEWSVPVGDVVSPCIYLTHHDPALYPQPHAFRPERFLGTKPDTYGWIPFGGGMRRCIGASFAQLEMREVLGAVLAAVDLRADDTAPELTGRRAIILAPRRGARAVVARAPALG